MTDRREAVAAIEEAARYKTKRKAVQDILARREEKAEELCRKLERVRGKARRMHRRGRYTRYDAASMLSRMGVFHHADAYNYYLEHIKPMVNIRKCKRRVAAAAKKTRESEGYQ